MTSDCADVDTLLGLLQGLAAVHARAEAAAQAHRALAGQNKLDPEVADVLLRYALVTSHLTLMSGAVLAHVERMAVRQGCAPRGSSP